MSDIHLGFRAYSATTPGGRNQREVDVEAAWFDAVRQIVDYQPHLVTIAGDVVHHPRVSAHAIKAWRDGVRVLSEDTDASIVVVVGNHDVPRTLDSLTPVIMPDDYRDVHVVREVTNLDLTLAGQRVRVACFPFVTLTDEKRFSLAYDPDADVNVLLMHAEVRGSEDGDPLPYFYGGDGAVLDVGREAERWDIIACGDYHEFRRLHPSRLAFYSGSIERTSSNIWSEHSDKCWVATDTEAGTLETRTIPTRRMLDYDLGDFDMPPGIGARELTDVLDELASLDIIDDALVRLKVDAFPAEERSAIDWAMVRRVRAKALHFNLDIRYARDEQEIGDRRDREGMTLADEAREFFRDDAEDVQGKALEYLGVVG